MNIICLSMWLLYLFSYVSLVVAQQNDPNLVHMCVSDVYCQGPILAAVNLHRLFNDSKSFVDMPLKKSQNETLNDFKQTFPNTELISKDRLAEFIDLHFSRPGEELIPHVPSDWYAAPKTFSVISDPTYRKWASNLNEIWKALCKEIDHAVKLNPDQYSLIYVPYPFVVPGGRFREFYYWDAYWMLKGLLVSEMINTTKYMILNYVEMVKQFGFVPNGGRIYYLKRSQPPMLTRMVYDYYRETGDKDFLKLVLPQLEQEYLFWASSRNTTLTTTSGKTYTVFQYASTSNVPRPESYTEDMQTGKQLNAEANTPPLYSNLASAAESGWDFSSRWLGDKQTLNTITTKTRIPVDLNAFICGNLKLLSVFYQLVGDFAKGQYYKSLHESSVTAMMEVFYNSTQGVWFDLDAKTKLHNTDFYPSTVSPLYTDCYEGLDLTNMERVLKYLQGTGALSFPAGVPTSLYNTSQQWDFPNGWPPLNHIIIDGLRRGGLQVGSQRMQDAAFALADKWIKNNYLVYNATGYMFEKYDVTQRTTAGGGGEYDVQIGFGWTNGVALDLLRTYGDKLRAPGTPIQNATSPFIRPTLTPNHKPPRSSSSLAKRNFILIILLIFISVQNLIY